MQTFLKVETRAGLHISVFRLLEICKEQYKHQVNKIRKEFLLPSDLQQSLYILYLSGTTVLWYPIANQLLWTSKSSLIQQQGYYCCMTNLIYSKHCVDKIRKWTTAKSQQKVTCPVSHLPGRIGTQNS